MRPIAYIVLLIVVTSGCSSLKKDWKEMLPWSAQSRIKNSKFETPTSMIAIWTPDILTQAGSPPTRGFGGRLYFYNDNNQAIPVEGQLVVYGYDDTVNKDQSGTPQRKFAFTPEQFANHHGESDLGASYSVWLPWDPAGGEQQQVSLVPVFTSTSGKVVMGQQAFNLLPGTVAQKEKKELPTSLLAAQPNGIQQVVHQQPQVPTDGQSSMNEAGAQQTRMRTSTIRLTPNMQRRLAMAAESPAENHEQANSRSEQPKPVVLPVAPNPTVANPPQPEGTPAPPNSDPRLTHSGWPRFPAREALTAQSKLPAPWTPPYPAGQLSALRQPSTPQMPLGTPAVR